MKPLFQSYSLCLSSPKKSKKSYKMLEILSIKRGSIKKLRKEIRNCLAKCLGKRDQKQKPREVRVLPAVAEIVLAQVIDE